MRSHLYARPIERLHYGARGEANLRRDLGRGQLFIYIKVSREHELVVAYLPWLLNLNPAVSQVLANRLVVNAEVPGKPFDRLHLAVQPNKLIDLFRL